MKNNIQKPFNKRAFVSVSMFISGMILPISGIMNHNLQFDTITSERHFWMSVHNMSATLFAFLQCYMLFTTGRRL